MAVVVLTQRLGLAKAWPFTTADLLAQAFSHEIPAGTSSRTAEYCRFPRLKQASFWKEPQCGHESSGTSNSPHMCPAVFTQRDGRSKCVRLMSAGIAAQACSHDRPKGMSHST